MGRPRDGRTDQDEAKRRAEMIGNVALIPLIGLLATEDSKDGTLVSKPRARAKG